MADADFRHSAKIALLVMVCIVIFAVTIVGSCWAAGAFKPNKPPCPTGIFMVKDLTKAPKWDSTMDYTQVICNNGYSYTQ